MVNDELGSQSVSKCYKYSVRHFGIQLVFIFLAVLSEQEMGSADDILFDLVELDICFFSLLLWDMEVICEVGDPMLDP